MEQEYKLSFSDQERESERFAPDDDVLTKFEIEEILATLDDVAKKFESIRSSFIDGVYRNKKAFEDAVDQLFSHKSDLSTKIKESILANKSKNWINYQIRE